VPRVLRTEGDTLFVACNEGSLQILNEFSGCPAIGERMHRNLYEAAFKSGVVESCARAAVTTFSGNPNLQGPVTIRHKGILANRNTSGGNPSHHAKARAIDLSEVHLGGLSFVHLRDFKARTADPQQRWNLFWVPYISCLMKRTLVKTGRGEIDEIERHTYRAIARLLDPEHFVQDPQGYRVDLDKMKADPRFSSAVSALVLMMEKAPSVLGLRKSLAFKQRVQAEISPLIGRDLTPSELEAFVRSATPNDILHRDHIHLVP
jgi:hypothetical protein